MIRNWMSLAVAALLTCHLSASGANRLESRPWPRPAPCPGCMTLQFGELELRLPDTSIDRVFAFPGATGLHLLLRGALPGRSLILLGSPRQEVIGRYPELPCSTTGQQFLDMLGRPNGHSLARQAEGVERAIRYTKASKGRLHAYWIEAAEAETQTVQIVVEGGDTVYTLAGELTPELYDLVLANLRIAPIP
ncbi:hypothetical protein [Pseudoduganella albidiflava]|uniref:Uncharacterized protein n=2 Tax=Pseudoduganella albidiflava TaxID=321983 RepID=A0ABX5S306_9BURK|nr:hypothetical protein [Pseudoduganella albidiflava]QBI04617.1 hypothetical protein EYF70_30180 [Pseudoduganella albidiflava]